MILNESDCDSSAKNEYFSCEFLEGGICFSYSTLRACAEIHHGTGEPELHEYTGGMLSLEKILAAKSEIIRRNQKKGHPNCTGCPKLVSRSWPRSRYPIRWLGITHWDACNLHCDYCWLQWAEWSPRKRATKLPPQMYVVTEAIHQLIDENWIAPNTLVDWGGGGEPTLIPEFDEVLRLLDAHGTTQWMHTNGTILPEAILRGTIDSRRIHVLCSVDAGTPETFRKIKHRNCYDAVWRNLQTYIFAGAQVTVKYLMFSGNCSRKEIDRFVRDALRFGRPSIVGDIDHRQPDPKKEIIEGLAYLKWLAEMESLSYSCGETGADSAPEFNVAERVEAAAERFKNNRYYRFRHYLMRRNI